MGGCGIVVGRVVVRSATVVTDVETTEVGVVVTLVSGSVVSDGIVVTLVDSGGWVVSGTCTR